MRHLLLIAAMFVLPGCAEHPTAPLFDPRKADGSERARVEAAMSDSFIAISPPPDDSSHSGASTHPAVGCMPNGMLSQCLEFHTPYKHSNARWENPSIALLRSPTELVTPEGVHNPVTSSLTGGDYNSDPDVLYDWINGRWLETHREVSGGFNRIMMIASRDAKNWSKPVLLFKEPNHDAVSQTQVLEQDSTLNIWYVQTGNGGCSASTSTVALRSAKIHAGQKIGEIEISAAQVTDLAIPGYVTWHLYVGRLYQRDYLALIAAFPIGTSCSNSDVFMARSSDRKHWKAFAVPVLWRSMQIAQNLNMRSWYRSTFRIIPGTDQIQIWTSQMYQDMDWSLGYTSTLLTPLLADLEKTTLADRPSQPAATRVPTNQEKKLNIEMP